ncbi:glycosyltransferase [Sphingomonas sp.]|uniref:glycosyltransferase n=1 Tax=Sphingomonas sp. TaxID=28214 RepID=UPI003341D949
MTPRTPKVGVLTASLSTAAGGLFFALRDVANRLEARGIPQSVFGLRDAPFEADRAAWHISHLAAFDGVGPRGFKVSLPLIQALDRAALDVLHVHGIWNFASLAGLQWQRRTHRPLVISPHGMLDPGALVFSPTKKRIVAALYERRALRSAAAIHALNAAEAAAVRAYGIDVPIAVIPNGVDLPDASVIAARDWSADRRRTMLFLARLHPKKGVQELIAAWRHMLDRAPAIGARWRLTLAGWDDGGLIDAARQQVTELGLTDHVTIPGAVFGDAKHDAFAQAHAFILPSRSEGLPISVLEAWAYGLPVFMTDACNVPSGFAANAAIRIETDSVALASVLAQRLADDSDLPAIGAKGRALVAQDFSWDRVVDDYSALYRWLAGDDVMPPFVQLSSKDT